MAGAEAAVALYARVSTQDGKQDPETQLGELRAWAGRNGEQVVAEYVDQASGAKADRSALHRLLKDAHTRRFDTVRIWALDRLSREGIAPMLRYLEQFEAAGVRVLSLRESWLDTKSPVTPLLIAVLAWVAEQERARIRERVVAGVRRAQKHGTRSGKAIGRPPCLTSLLPLLKLREKGLSIPACAQKLGVSETTVKRALRQNPAVFEATG